MRSAFTLPPHLALSLAAGASVLALAATAAFAQTEGGMAPPPAPAANPTVPTLDVVHARMDRDEERIAHGVQDGSLNDTEAHRVHEELVNIRTQEAELAKRDGVQLNDTDLQFINDRLDQLGHSIHWLRTRPELAW